MKLMTMAFVSTALLVGASMPIQAQSLLGIIGGKDDGALITIGSGNAGDSGLVNLGLGGDGQLLDANVGDGSIANATVGTGSSGGVGANVGLLNNTARVGVGVGGDNLLDVDVGIGGGNPGGGNNGGGNNGGGNGGGNGNGGGMGPGPNPGGFSVGSRGDAVVCQGVSSSELERLIVSTRVDSSWRRAQAVDVRKVSVCPELRTWLATALQQTGLGNTLRSAIGSDELLAATLNRSSYSADRVFAVRADGSRLTVFVY